MRRQLESRMGCDSFPAGRWALSIYAFVHRRDAGATVRGTPVPHRHGVAWGGGVGRLDRLCGSLLHFVAC